ncbi:hypothetical protein B0I18_102469 [Taibaiella chishuiensis]|uniref:Uncharacterized protein n=1 Tax=Taibaiella chishuiensis TaxID=1434707 RepID=A0A2P8D8G8_9BACT|nr:hypothetical protein B0I18_102469 [Taibaiella chishuiensis]
MKVVKKPHGPGSLFVNGDKFFINSCIFFSYQEMLHMECGLYRAVNKLLTYMMGWVFVVRVPGLSPFVLYGMIKPVIHKAG